MHLRHICVALLSAAVVMAASGCHDHHRNVRVEVDAYHVHDAYCGHYWDGHVWLVTHDHVHGAHCGHWWHHGAWHLYPEDHAYYYSGHAHFGIYVDFGHVHDAHCGHVWDGGDWVIVTGHVHRAGCGHHYHHSAWHVYPESHVYREPYKASFGVRVKEPAPAQRAGPRRIRPEPEPRRPDPGKAEPRKPDPRRPEPPGPREPKAEPGEPPGPGIEPGGPHRPPDPPKPKDPKKPKKPGKPK